MSHVMGGVAKPHMTRKHVKVSQGEVQNTHVGVFRFSPSFLVDVDVRSRHEDPVLIVARRRFPKNNEDGEGHKRRLSRSSHETKDEDRQTPKRHVAQ